MKIQANIELEGKKFAYVSEDSRDRDAQTIIVKTKMNEKFWDEIDKGAFIEAHELSKHFDKNIKIIGITGTNGKSTTGAMIYSTLIDMGHSVALLGTRGFFVNGKIIAPKGLTTPSMVELYGNIQRACDLGCEYFVMEVSSHAIAQDRICGIDFALKIATNITSDHLDFHKTLEEYIAVKNRFLSDGVGISNNDDRNIKKCMYTYGIENGGGLKVNAFCLKGGIDAQISFAPTKEDAMIYLNMYGKHNLYNALACILAIKILTNAKLESITKSLEKFEGIEGRMEIVSSEPLIVVDFAHTHDGMEKIFESFLGKKIVVVFGAGGDRDRSKRALMGKMAQKYAHKIYLTSDNPRSEEPMNIISDILEGMSKEPIVEVDRKKAIELAIENLEYDEVLLILGKGDETYQIIGDRKIDFDDREIVRDVLKSSKKWRGSNENTDAL